MNLKFYVKVMCKCSYNINENGPDSRRRSRVILPPSSSSSQATTPKTNRISRPSSSASPREVTTTFFSSPRPSQALEVSRRSTVLISSRDHDRSGGSTPRLFLNHLKRGKIKRRVTIGSHSSGSGDADEPDWPPSADEDYIVFCFEEDGAFHVVMEESPRTLSRKLQGEDHDNANCACDQSKDVNNLRPAVSRRDCLLADIEAEDGLEKVLSPKKVQVKTEISDLLAKDKIILRKESTESMECRNGSIESTDSNRLDWEEQLLKEADVEPVSPSSLCDSLNEADRKQSLSADQLVEEEEEVYLSPKSKLGMILRFDDLLKGDDTGSNESSGFSESDSKSNDDDEQQLKDDEEPGSAKSSVSDQSETSSSAFEFPVLEWEWVGSPVPWPRRGNFHASKLIKHKTRRDPRPACLRCCRFL